MYSFNNRVLVIDDEEVVRDSFLEILSRRDLSYPLLELEAASAALFDEPLREQSRSTATYEFSVDVAGSGQHGLTLIERALQIGKPYALVFLDVRMPGWDGMETAKRIRTIDEQVEIVFVTAFSDYGIQDIAAAAGANVGYHCKPFAPEEISQIATRSVHEWNLLRSLEALIAVSSELHTGDNQIDRLLLIILGEICRQLGSVSAAVLLPDVARTSGWACVLAVGELLEPSRLQPIIEEFSISPPPNTVKWRAGMLIIPVVEYKIVALIEDAHAVRRERLYLLRLFINNAAKAIERARMQATLMQSEKLSVMGLALLQVVHDLRQPLAVIHNAINLVVRGVPEASTAKLHRMLKSSADDLRSYVDDLLTFTNNEPAKVELVSLSELLHLVEDKTQLLLNDRQHWLHFDIEPGVLAKVEVTKIQRVVLNLINNAVEGLSTLCVENPTVIVSLRRRDEGLAICVSDNGPGVPEEIRATIFKPFVTHGKVGGTGLGLAICRSIAERHGGTLELAATNKGAVFELTLPSPERY